MFLNPEINTKKINLLFSLISLDMLVFMEFFVFASSLPHPN